MTLQDAKEIIGRPGSGPVPFGRRGWISIALGVGILLVLCTTVDLPAVWRELSACRWGWIVAGAGVHYASYPVRAYRWQRCLRHVEVRGGTRRFTCVVLFHNFVDNILPAKLGDLYGAHLAHINLGVRRSTALGSLVFLRIVDAWVVLTAAIVSWVLLSTQLPAAVLEAVGCGVGLALVFGTAVLAVLLARGGSLNLRSKRLYGIVDALRQGLSPRREEWLPIAGLTVFIWALEIGCLVLMGAGFGVRLGAAEAACVTATPALASSFPFTPGGMGVVDLTLVGCLRALGITGVVAVSLTIVNRFFDYWLHIGIGVVMWTLRGWIGLRTWRDAPSYVCADSTETTGGYHEGDHVG